MKKVLLSLSMLAAVAVANAQNFKIWNAADGTGFIGAGTPYTFDGITADTANSAPFTITATGSTTGYYVGGFGNASYAATSELQPIGYTAANFATDKFYMNVNGPSTQVKVQFSTVTNGVKDADVYGRIFDLAQTTGTAFIDQSALLSSFSKLAGPNSAPDGVNFLTAALAAKISTIEFAINFQNNSGVGTATVKLKNLTIGTSSALNTQSAAAKIASTRVFPNPSTSAFTAEVSLKNAATTTIILSDLVGKQISSKSVDASGQANFETAGLAAGTYVVTYVVDGAPAKSELVVVK